MATGGSPERGDESENQNDSESSTHLCEICHTNFPKKYNPSRFGILPECRHVFCLTCVRTSRKTNLTEDDTAAQLRRRCPKCRKVSDFVVPSNIYIDDVTEIENLVQEYKRNCGKKACQYEEQRLGSCNRRADCHYNHDLIVGMNLQGQVGPVEPFRMSKSYIRVNRNTPSTHDVPEAEDEDDVS